MKTKNIFKALALAILIPSMLLSTACNSEIINNENTEGKGFSLPVTVNVTRQCDDPATKATYNASTRKLEFSTGDKLFVNGTHTTAGQFAGTLTWTSGGTFSGTITTENEWTGTADALFTAATKINAYLLPAGYESIGFLTIIPWTSAEYDDVISTVYNNAFALTLAAGIEQLSLESANAYSSGFALTPVNAILNFTINGLPASTEVAVIFSDGHDTVDKKVTTDASGNAKFVVGVLGTGSYTNIQNCTLTVDNKTITLASGSKTLEKGKIYNITRCVNAINGQFSVSSTKKVFFSKGNLQATTTNNGTSWTWAFAANQWSYVGNAAANTSMKEDGSGTVTANGTVDLFGWVGASSSWTSAAQWGISASKTSADYGNVANEALKSDWGNVPGIGTGWRTLTSGDTDSGEWDYLFKTRSASTVAGTENARYAKATVNSVAGVVLFPDVYTHPAGVTDPANINTENTNYNANTWSGTDWTKMETAGCVFLPAGGNRSGTTVTNAGTGGYYWTSTPTGSSVYYSVYRVFYNASKVTTSNSTGNRYAGYSVRLVHDAN